jgi:hypothetical protein
MTGRLYPPVLVAEIEQLWREGRGLTEIMHITGRTQRVTWDVMRRYRIAARVAAEQRQPSGRAEYAAHHYRVSKLRGKPSRCNRCGTTDLAKTYDWASLTGNYADPDDYERMCRSCHRRYDNARRKAGAT